MTVTDQSKALLAAVFEDIDDQPRKLVYADWLEENGRDDEADCWRWFATKNKRPSETYKGNYYWNTIEYVNWFKAYDLDEKHLDVSTLLHTWLENIRLVIEGGKPLNRGFPTMEKAFAEAVEAWVNKLTPEQRAECWGCEP